MADGEPDYEGARSPAATITSIDGVPGTAAAIRLAFEDVAGGSCGALLPTGNVVDVVDGIEVTLIDHGMPVVVLRAADLGVTGTETPAELEGDEKLRARLEAIRLAAGPMMHLGDVAATTVPKLTMVSPPTAGGDLGTRTFIPHRCHEAIGVLGAVSVATAALLDGSPAAAVRRPSPPASRSSAEGAPITVVCEHPTGSFTTEVAVVTTPDGAIEARRAGIVRTARKLMDGVVFGRAHR